VALSRAAHDARNLAATVRATRVQRLSLVRSWAVVRHDVELSDLEAFDLVVCAWLPKQGTGGLGQAHVRALQQRGALVVSHLRLVPQVRSSRGSTAQTVEWSVLHPSLQAHPAGASARRPGGSVVKAAEVAAGQGFDGVYLDELDLCQSSPAAARALKELLRRLGRAVPDLLVIAQQAPELSTATGVDAFGFERPLLEPTDERGADRPAADGEPSRRQEDA